MNIWAIEEEEKGKELQTLLQEEEDAKAMSATDMQLVARQQQKKADQLKENSEAAEEENSEDTDSQAEQASQTSEQTSDDGQPKDEESEKAEQLQAQVEEPPDEETKQVTQEHWSLVSESLLGDTASMNANTLNSVVNTDSLKFIGYLGLGAALKAGTVALGAVLYLMEKTIKLLFTGIISLKDYMYRRMNSFESLHTQIKDLKAAVKAMDVTPVKPGADDYDIKPTYTSARIINNLKISDSVDFSKNLMVMTAFLQSLNKEVSSAALKDLKFIGYIADLDSVNFAKLKNEGMYSEGFGSVFSKDLLDGYVSDHPSMEFWRSSQTLPGDTSLFINIPSTSITDKETAEKAFSKANCGIGIDTHSFVDIDSVEYLDKAQLLNLLDRMEKLCLEALSHRQLYAAVLLQKSNMRFKFKVFFAELMSTNDRVFASKKVSAVHFRMQYVDKIYLKMTMDVHDLCVKVLVNAISFAQKNSTKL